MFVMLNFKFDFWGGHLKVDNKDDVLRLRKELKSPKSQYCRFFFMLLVLYYNYLFLITFNSYNLIILVKNFPEPKNFYNSW